MVTREMASQWNKYLKRYLEWYSSCEKGRVRWMSVLKRGADALRKETMMESSSSLMINYGVKRAQKSEGNRLVSTNHVFLILSFYFQSPDSSLLT